MPMNNVPTKAEVESGDPLTEKIRQSILEVENLRAENRLDGRSFASQS